MGLIRNMEIKRLLLTTMWDNISEEEWEKLPCGENDYVYVVDLITFAESEFKKAASTMGIEYNYFVKRIFKKQNKQYFKNAEIFPNGKFKKSSNAIQQLRYLLLVPKISKADRILKMIQELPDEEKQELILKIGRIKLKVKLEIENL